VLGSPFRPSGPQQQRPRDHDISVQETHYKVSSFWYIEPRASEKTVPEGDIDSALTNWVCSCGRCWKVHQAKDGDCEKRRMKRTVARLGDFQYRFTELVNSLTLLEVVDGYQYPAGFEKRRVFPAHLTRVLYKRDARSPAAQEAPIAMTLPVEMRKQAAAVENCVGAVVSLSPALAWLTKGKGPTIHSWKRIANNMQTLN
jgi:hypothetical protein